MFLKNQGFNPTLIVMKNHINKIFLNRYLNVEEINDYSQIKKDKYDLLLADSDQLWNYQFKYLLKIGFLSFAKNWTIPKFVYAASLGHDIWNVSQEVLNSARVLVTKLSGISVREYNSVKLIENYLGVKPYLVLDPTFLIDKNDYLNLTKNIEFNLNLNENYICSYILDKTKIKSEFIQKAASYLKYKIINIGWSNNNCIEYFIFSINRCKAILTDSYHGTVFSIIFNKPFITFINTFRGRARFASLNQTFNLKNRFIYPKEFNIKDIDILKNELNIDRKEFNLLKKQSFQFLEQNLGVKLEKIY